MASRITIDPIDPAALAVFDFHWGAHITFGRGALRKLATAIGARPERRVLLVTSPSIGTRSSLLDTVAGHLVGRQMRVFDGIRAAPDIDAVQGAIDFARASRSEAVIGMGGGSVMDAAKTVALLARTRWDLRTYLQQEPDTPPDLLFTILIPTTAGSGSEVTRWATIWDTAAKRKLSVTLPRLPSRPALLDPELTLTLPPLQTAISGADALAHALEAYWSKNANPASDRLALAAVHRISTRLFRAQQEPMNVEHRSEMLLASLLAGLAFNRTETAAAHAISYPLTSHFGIPHGQATGVSLPLLLGFNAEVAPKRFAPLCRALGAATVPEAQGRLRGLLERVGLKTRLRDLGVPLCAVPMLAAAALTSNRLPNNVRTIGPAEMVRLLTDLW
jgi:phosphonate metabolism-associated iron-containing alcohol dehydrogenase